MFNQNKFIKIILVFVILLTSISCRKKQIYKKKKVIHISKEMKEAIKKNETAKLLWKNRTDINTLEKAISLWEEVTPYIDTTDINLYLSEAYYLHSLFPIKDNIKITNYKKSIKYSYKVLLDTSKEYKIEKNKSIQDYKIISLIPKNRFLALYLYTINTILLRVKEDTLLLYRDDIIASIEHLENILPKENFKDLLAYKAYFYFYLPQFGGGDKNKSIAILKENILNHFLSAYFYIKLFSENKNDDYKNLLKIKWDLTSKDKIIYKEIYKKSRM